MCIRILSSSTATSLRRCRFFGAARRRSLTLRTIWSPAPAQQVLTPAHHPRGASRRLRRRVGEKRFGRSSWDSEAGGARPAKELETDSHLDPAEAVGGYSSIRLLTSQFAHPIFTERGVRRRRTTATGLENEVRSAPGSLDNAGGQAPTRSEKNIFVHNSDAMPVEASNEK
eukprot:6201327-Pleurochrysis_carterae.AAC.2